MNLSTFYFFNKLGQNAKFNKFVSDFFEHFNALQ